MHDILPEQTPRWQQVEAVLRDTLTGYGYEEIRMPLLEATELFKRSIGEVTDIVEKEMYTFEDRNGDSLTLRPEGTAGCLRACLEHGLIHNQARRLWYYGPMYRHEKPQKGRYRQFYQLGVEAYGMAGPDIDAELILLSRRFWQRLGLEGKLELQLNSLGSTEERLNYRQKLVDYFSQHKAQLDEDSHRRLNSNPLRILDSKNRDMQALIAGAPVLTDYLGEDSATHFKLLTDRLDQLGIHYTLNPRLVRGLDYYGKTVFEWVTNELGSQGTVCAGGRYDSLVDQLGGKTASAIGFAMGIERLIDLIEIHTEQAAVTHLDVYMICVGTDAEQAGLRLSEQLRDTLPPLKLLHHCGGGSFKSQFKRADKSGAEYALILGEDEINHDTISIKPLRNNQDQFSLPQTELASRLQSLIHSGD